MDEYDTDEEATAPIKNNLPQAPQIHPLSNRICPASYELQPSPQGQRPNHPSVWHQKFPDVTQITETSRPSLLEISPASERHERTLGPALRQAIDLPEPSLPLHQTSQQPWQVRKSQDITEHHSELMATRYDSLPNRQYSHSGIMKHPDNGEKASQAMTHI